MHIGPFYPNRGVRLTQPMGKQGPVQEIILLHFTEKLHDCRLSYEMCV